ncbi:MAG: hypothetical protein QXF23_01090 [Candidatus Bathyarchaeia archaeon]
MDNRVKNIVVLRLNLAIWQVNVMWMKSEDSRKIAWALTLEILLAGAYVSLTRGLFIIYLTSIGYSVDSISFVTLSSALSSIIFGILIYKRPNFIIRRIKAKLITFHALERLTWMIIPLTQNLFTILSLYSIQLVSSFLINTFISYIIYGSLTEDLIRDVTAKRSAANGVSSIMGFLAGTALLAFLPPESKFKYIFIMGSLIGLVSTLIVATLNVSHLEGKMFPEAVEEPERIFSSSIFSIVFFSSGNILGIVWAPYVIRYLGGADYIASLMSLAGTMSNSVASLFWRRRSFKSLHFGLIANALGPILILVTPWPVAHVGINIYTSFTYTGASFITAFLFARYNRWFGAIKSGILLVLFNSCAQLVASITGLLIKENFIILFLAALSAKLAASLLASLTIPETALIPENLARTYSQILYNSSLMGYQMGVELSKETIMMALRFLALLLTVIILYMIYYILWILINLG